MNSVQAALLLTLVWTFSAVCQADDDFSVSCVDVTGSVGKEVTFTCSVSLLKTDCCIIMYKFQYPKGLNDSDICRQELPKDSCDQRNSFRCSYTSTTSRAQQFRFFMQTGCRPRTTKFTVNITDKAPIEAGVSGFMDTTSFPVKDLRSKDTSSKYAAIAAAVSCLSIVLIITTIICKTKPKFTKPCGFQKWMFLCVKHDEENTTPPEDSAVQDLI